MQDTLDTRTCKACGEKKAVTAFAPTPSKKHRRHTCIACFHRRRYARRRVHLLATDAARRKKNIVQTVWEDSRRTDKKMGRGHDLSKGEIAKLLSQPCSYCGDQSLRMTIDRIDNSLGHVVGNVVGACIRCNYTRKNMPHAAWLVVAEGMRIARERGLFGEWTGRIK